MLYDIVLRDATIVSSTGRTVADVAIQDGRIAYVGPRPPRKGKEEVQAIGKFLMAGVIDSAALLSPDGSAETWDRESQAAVSGGITTVLALPGERLNSRAEARERAARFEGHSWTNFGLWGQATSDNLAELDAAAREGLVVGALATLAEGRFTTDQLAPWLRHEGVLGVRIDQAADPAKVVEALVALATPSKRPVHLFHLSTSRELQQLEPVRGEIPVTAGITPHHLSFCSEEDTHIRTRPPIRMEEDRRTLWTAVKRGRLDCIASDHLPVAAGEVGLPGAELLFPLLLSAAKYGKLSLELVAAICAERPARIFGLDRKGKIEKGYDADLVLFSEGEVTKVTPELLLSGAGWSPYAQRETARKPEAVYVGGQLVAQRGKIVGRAPQGRIATRAVAEA